jgi:Sulfotransferase family
MIEPAPFFLVGNDRSGTTMLRLVLDRGDVAIPSESMFLADFAPLRHRGGLEDRERAERFLREVWTHPRVRAWGLGPHPPPLPAGLGHAEAYRFCVEAPFLAYARREEKPRWADKTPYYLHCVDELLAVWPEARFVVLVRDGRDVALSILNVPFGATNVWAAGRAWAAGIRLGLEAARRHPGRVLSVRHEDLVTEPETRVRGICEFLGLQFRPDMLAIEQTDPSKIVEDQSAWFTNVWAGINASGAGRWRRELSPGDQRLFAAVAGAELEAVGYERGPAPPPVGRGAAGLYAAQDALARVGNFVRLRLVQQRGHELRYVLKRKLRSLWA